jgi:hypothetical protein
VTRLLIVATPVLVLYVTAYFAIVTPATWHIENITLTMPEYRFGGHYSERIFAPAHWCDRRIRPELWPVTYWAPETNQEIPVPNDVEKSLFAL